MDQIKIGKFIAERRKKNNLTQAQLAEKLSVTDRSVSKWETGRAMPDTAIMLDLCEILKISVNDLLNGEIVIMENYNEKNEKVLLDMAKEVEQKNKAIWTAMWAIIIVSIVGLLASVFALRFLLPGETWQTVGILVATAVFLIPLFYALKLEVSVGAYKCKKCGHEIEPTYTQALKAMHMGTTRYLKCPKCNKRSWCKKVINKE